MGLLLSVSLLGPAWAADPLAPPWTPTLTVAGGCDIGRLSPAQPRQTCRTTLAVRALRPVWLRFTLIPLRQGAWTLPGAFTATTPDGQRIPITDTASSAVVVVPMPPSWTVVIGIEGEAAFGVEPAGSYAGQINVMAR